MVGLQPPKQFNIILQYDDKSVISIDVTLETSEYNYVLYILIIFDVFHNGFSSA